MKRYLIIFSFLTFLSFCSSKEQWTSENYDATIVYYHLGLIDRASEIISVRKVTRHDSLTFTYTYKKLQEDQDRLVIFTDSVRYNNVKLKFLDKRNFQIGTKNIEIEKYLCRADGYSLHIYIDKLRGLRLTRNRWNNIIVEYNLDNDVITNRIVKDTIFFNKE